MGGGCGVYMDELPLRGSTSLRLRRYPAHKWLKGTLIQNNDTIHVREELWVGFVLFFFYKNIHVMCLYPLLNITPHTHVYYVFFVYH